MKNGIVMRLVDYLYLAGKVKRIKYDAAGFSDLHVPSNCLQHFLLASL